MSVTTTADERISSAKQHVKDALSQLSDVVVEECWGHDDYRPDYRAKIDLAYINLLAVKSQLEV